MISSVTALHHSKLLQFSTFFTDTVHFRRCVALGCYDCVGIAIHSLIHKPICLTPNNGSIHEAMNTIAFCFNITRVCELSSYCCFKSSTISTISLGSGSLLQRSLIWTRVIILPPFVKQWTKKPRIKNESYDGWNHS